MKYEPIPPMSREQIEAAIERNDVDVLPIVVLSAVLSGHDREWAQGVCERLSKHPHAGVRGNAVLGFGHLARLHEKLDEAVALPVILAGLRDPDEYVRGHADSAADDVKTFLGWLVPRTPPV